MANHASAVKRHRQSLKRRDRNRDKRTAIRSAIKEARQAAETGNKTKAVELMKAAERLLAKSSTKGLYHKRAASRKISRLAISVNKTLAAKKA